MERLQTKIINAQAKVYNEGRGASQVSTMGGILVNKFKKKYGLATCHGLKHLLDLDNQFDEAENRNVILADKNLNIGTLRFIELSESLDIALIKLDKELESQFDNGFIGNPDGHYNVTADDDNKLEVVLFSSIQNTQKEGFLINHSFPKAQLTFNNIKSIEIHDLGVISSALVNGKSLTEAGDSGAWVRSKKDNKVLGMVIGEDENKEATYFIKMETILSYDNIMAYKIF